MEHKAVSTTPVVPPPEAEAPTTLAAIEVQSAPPLDKIVDSAGVVWSLGPDSVPGGRSVLKNGEAFVGGGTRLVLKDARLYLMNSGQLWFTLSDDGAAWVITVLDPTAQM